jgi:hypothetical protein
MKRLVVLVVVGLAVGACGDGGGSSASFCDDMEVVEGDLAALASGESELDDAVDRLRELDPPGAIEDEFGDVVDVYGEIASESGAVTDPAMANRLEGVRADVEAVESFVAEECSASD